MEPPPADSFPVHQRPQAYSPPMPAQDPAQEFREILAGEHGGLTKMRHRMGRVPSSPRCKLCMAPFGAPGGTVLRYFGFGRFPGNPAICQNCIGGFTKRGLTGAEVATSLLFA